jgi:hypothetical protein
MFAAAPLIIALLATASAVVMGLGGRAFIRRREHPERVVGRGLKLYDIEWPRAERELPVAQVLSHDGHVYEALLTVDTPGVGSRVRVSARHKGYPISGASPSRAIAVAGISEKGGAFLALAKLIGV